jgi:hypothetical protein
MFAEPIIYTSRKRAEFALDRQRPNGFSVMLSGGFSVSHDTSSMWFLTHRSRPINDPVAWGSIAEVLNAWETNRMRGWGDWPQEQAGLEAQS